MMGRRFLARLGHDRRGTMVIETAIVFPVLAMLSIGGFEVSTMVSRQSELQSAAAEAAAIALAAAPDDSTKRDTVKNVIMASTGLSSANVTLTPMYRCGAATAYVSNSATCAASDKIANYVKIHLTDTYTPIWTQYSVGSPLHYSVNRYVLLNQST